MVMINKKMSQFEIGAKIQEAMTNKEINRLKKEIDELRLCIKLLRNNMCDKCMEKITEKSNQS